MEKHLHTQFEVDLMVQRAQAIARKHPLTGKLLVSDDLIRERRAEARREMNEAKQSHSNRLRKQDGSR